MKGDTWRKEDGSIIGEKWRLIVVTVKVAKVEAEFSKVFVE